MSLDAVIAWVLAAAAHLRLSQAKTLVNLTESAVRAGRSTPRVHGPTTMSTVVTQPGSSGSARADGGDAVTAPVITSPSTIVVNTTAYARAIVAKHQGRSHIQSGKSASRVAD